MPTSRVRPGVMPGADEWAEALPVDTSEDVYVATPGEDVFVFYTEREAEFIRTDRALHASEWR